MLQKPLPTLGRAEPDFAQVLLSARWHWHCSGTQHLGSIRLQTKPPKQTHPRAEDTSYEVLLLPSLSHFPYLYNGDTNPVVSGMLLSD